MIHDNRELGYSVIAGEYYQRTDLFQHRPVEESRTEARFQLSQISGITNESILNDLLEYDVNASTVAALELVPLILIAWADGAVEPGERAAIIKASGDYGIMPSQPAYQQLLSWLDEAPAPSLYSTWRIYVRGLTEAMDYVSIEEWKNSVLDRAQFIAAAASGFMGLGFMISAAEKAILVRLESAFSI